MGKVNLVMGLELPQYGSCAFEISAMRRVCAIAMAMGIPQNRGWLIQATSLLSLIHRRVHACMARPNASDRASDHFPLLVANVSK